MHTNAASLRGALRVLKQLVVLKPTLPVLGNIRLEATAGQLSVEGTDLDTRVIFTMPAADNLPPVLLPFKRLATLLEAAGAKQGNVGLALDGRRVRVDVNGRAFTLDSPIPAAEYPSPVPVPKTIQRSSTYPEPAYLAEVLDWLTPAISSDETRVMLTGLCFDGPRLIACDGHRMHIVEGVPPLDGRATLPGPAVRTLLALLKTCDPDWMKVDLGEGIFVFQANAPDLKFTMTSRAVQAEFPDHTEVIPNSDKTAAEVSVPQLDAALVLAHKVAGRGHAKLTLNGTLVVEASDLDDGGTLREQVDAVRVHGDAEVQVGIDVGFLRDALEGGASTAIIGMTDERSPVTVRFPDNEARLAVVMPLRL